MTLLLSLSSPMLMKQLAFTAAAVLLLDAVYIWLVKSWFARMIVSVQKTAMQVRLWPTIACYMLVILGLWYFVIRTRRPDWEAFLLGVFVYGTYELTNLATIKHWSSTFAAIDTLWGGLLFLLVGHVVKIGI